MKTYKINELEFNEKMERLVSIMTMQAELDQATVDFVRSLVFDSCLCSKIDIGYLLINKTNGEEVEIFPTLAKLADFCGIAISYASRILNGEINNKKWIIKRVRWNSYYQSKQYFRIKEGE